MKESVLVLILELFYCGILFFHLTTFEARIN
jgi:hypothetical protein